MGIMDQIKNQAMGGAINKVMGGEQSPLVAAAIQLLLTSGGLGGVSQKFQNAGLSEMMSSWIGTGPNMPVSGQQLESAFGREQIEGVAKQSNMPYGEVTSGLSRLLPEMVNKLTPSGRVPSEMPDSASLLSMGMNLLKH